MLPFARPSWFPEIQNCITPAILRFVTFFVAVNSCCFYSFAQPGNAVSAVDHFIRSLDEAQKLKALYPFETEERFNFHFVPKNDRKGISLNELDATQKAAALALLKSCVSEEGFEKATAIMQLETVLKEIEHRGASDNLRDPGKYFFTIFGVPAKNTIWGWRLEGHHVAFNFSARNNKLVASTPNFLGSNPAIVPEGPQKGKQILKDEAEVAFRLLHSFSQEQLKKVVLSDKAPADIITFNKRRAAIESTGSLQFSEMTKPQQETFLRLIRVYIHRYTKNFAEQMFKEMQQAGMDQLRFAWMGSQQQAPGNAHYYRIQGPTIIIEYDNVQNDANHIHTVVRDLLHDFGGDLLLEHYKKSH